MVDYNDYPILDCAAQAFEIVERGGDVYQKWTCSHCNSRQTMEEKNKFFTSGKCEECNKITEIKECNYLAVMGKNYNCI